jgi:hypothetical protein
VLQSQLTDLIKEVAELRAETRGWQGGHESQHEKDKRDQLTGRRWLIGTCVGILAAMVALIALVFQVLSEIKH